MSIAVRMHAVGGPEVLHLDEVDVAAPGPGEVRIRVRALALNRADVMLRTGNHFIQPKLPQAIGLEAAGIIEAIGPDVESLAVGDAVSVVPAYVVTDYPLHGELVLAPVRAVVRHPPHLSFEQAAAIWMAYVTAYGALIDIAHITSGDVVVIPAASSSVGLAAIQIVNMIGAKAVALTRTSDKRQQLLDAGAAAVIASSEEDVAARLDDITEGAGVDVIFDPVGGPMLATLMGAAARYCQVLVYGALNGLTLQVPVLALLEHRMTIRGYDMVEVASDDARLEAAVAFINQGLSEAKLVPIIDETFKLADVADAYRHMERNNHFGKIVVSVP